MRTSEVSSAVLASLQARDHATQAALLHAHRPTLERLVARITGSASEAESLVADLFADFFFKHVDQVRTARAIPAYLRIMAVRRARRLHTQAARSEELREETLAHTSDTRVDEEAVVPSTAVLVTRARWSLKHFFYWRPAPSLGACSLKS